MPGRFTINIKSFRIVGKMKTTFTLIILGAFSLYVPAQNKCDLPLSSAPAIFNLRLGMNGDEAKRAVGGKLSIKNKAEGVFFKNFIKKSPPNNLPGLRAIYLRFFDFRIYQIEIFYEVQPNPMTVEEFVKKFSAENKLEFDSWKIKNGIGKLECESFSIISDNYLNPRIELTDTDLKAQFKNSVKK